LQKHSLIEKLDQIFYPTYARYWDDLLFREYLLNT